MAAAGRVEFGRHENTRRAVFMAFAYFGSFGPERVCYATVEHVAERAKVSARTVQRHSPALVSRELIYAPTRAGGHVPTVWKILVSEPAPIERGPTLCRPRGDSVSPNIRDRGSSSGPRPKGASAPQKEYGKDCGKRPVTTAAPLKGSPAPFVLLATAEQAQPHVEAMRRIAQETAKTTPTITNDDDRAHGHQPTHSDEQEALFKEQDRQLQQQREATFFTPHALQHNALQHNALQHNALQQAAHSAATIASSGAPATTADTTTAPAHSPLPTTTRATETHETQHETTPS